MTKKTTSKSAHKKTKLQPTQTHEKNNIGHRGKQLTELLLVSIVGVLLLTGNLLFWASNTLLNTDRFVATISPVIKDPAVNKGLATYTTNQLFTRVDVEEVLTDALPPRADFLAPTLTKQIQSATENSLQKYIFSNVKFQDAWNNTLATAHGKALGFVKNYDGNGVISLNGVYQNISGNLEGSKLSFLADKQLPESVGSITIASMPNLPLAHSVVANINLYQMVVVACMLVLAALSVWLSSNRRRMVIRLGVMVSVLMAASLIGVRVLVSIASNQVDPIYRDAAHQVVAIVFHPFVIQSRAILLVGLLAAFIAWISGPSKAALAGRERVTLLLNGNIHHALFGNGENVVTQWTAKHKAIIDWAIVAVFAIGMMMLEMSPITIAWSALLLLILLLIVEIIAAPMKIVKKPR